MSNQIGLGGPSVVATQFGNSGSFVRMPCLPGMPVTDPTGLQNVMLAANASFEPINMIRGMAMPGIAWIGIPISTWFTAAALEEAFTLKDSGSGLLLYGASSGSNPDPRGMGGIFFRVGAGISNDEVSGKFSGSFWSRMTLASGGKGTPVSCRMDIMPAGTAATSFDTSTIDTTDYSGYGGMYLSDGVTFNSALTEVMAWSLTIDNGIYPDLALQGSAAPGLGEKLFPARYLNNPVTAMFQVTQRTGASAIQDDVNLFTAAALNTTLYIEVLLKNASNADPIRITLGVKKPDRGSAVPVGTTLIQRTYGGIGQYGGSGDSYISQVQITNS